jgi:hypothetical protein
VTDPPTRPDDEDDGLHAPPRAADEDEGAEGQGDHTAREDCPHKGPHSPAADKDQPGSFTDLDAFVTGLLAPAYAREVRNGDTAARWCPQWRAHPPAVWRLDALWRAWCNLPDDDPDAVCLWWLERADPTMAALTNPATGAFAGCGPTRHHRPADLPVTTRPGSDLIASQRP